MVRTIFTAILIGLLTACSIGLEPNSQLVKQAIALQVEQTQQQLGEQLNLDIKEVEINSVALKKREPLKIQDLPAYHVQGTYNVTLKLPKRRITQEKNPFDVYLQRQKEGKTWRLALPRSIDNTTSWRTYLIQ